LHILANQWIIFQILPTTDRLSGILMIIYQFSVKMFSLKMLSRAFNEIITQISSPLDVERQKTDFYSEMAGLDNFILSPIRIVPPHKIWAVNPPCPRIALYPPGPKLVSIREQG